MSWREISSANPVARLLPGPWGLVCAGLIVLYGEAADRLLQPEPRWPVILLAAVAAFLTALAARFIAARLARHKAETADPFRPPGP